MARVLAISDLHEPYAHKDALQFCIDVKEKFACDTIVFMGDELDWHSLSFHTKNPDLPSAGDEFRRSLEAMQKWYKTFPEATVLKSNHGSRPFRVAFEHGLPETFLKDYKTYMQAPEGWNWVDDAEIDGVRYSHGEDCRGGQSGLYATVTKHRQSCVYSHWHSFGGVQYSATKKDMLFGLNCGCLIDCDALAFVYGRHFPNKPTLGVGVILDGTGFFIPMPLESKVKKNPRPKKGYRGLKL